MQRFRLVCALALPGLVMAACESTPSGPNQAGFDPSFLVVPSPSVEVVEVCKAYTGSLATNFSFNGVNTQTTLTGGNPFTVAAETCRRVLLKGGTPTTVTVTETSIPAGVQLDSIVVHQLTSGVTTSTKLTGTASAQATGGGTPPSGGVIVFYNSDIPVTGEGCTPGYWKNHLSSWSGYTSGQTLGSVFNLGGFTSLSSSTLLQALSFDGGSGTLGGAKILLRAAVAALLNSASSGVDYPSTTAEVIADVNAALASNNRSTMLTLAGQLDADNNLGCPLN